LGNKIILFIGFLYVTTKNQKKKAGILLTFALHPSGSRSGGDRLAGSMIVEAPDGVLLPAFGTNGTSVPDVCCIRLAGSRCMLHDVGSIDVVCIPLAASALLWRCFSGMMDSWQARCVLRLQMWCVVLHDVGQAPDLAVIVWRC